MRLLNTPVKLPPPKSLDQWFTDREFRPIEVFLQRSGRGGRPRIRQPHWMRCVRPGDVLENRVGVQRVVRTVFYYSTGRLHSVHCTIMHCSQYHTCYTSLDAARLLREGFQRVARVSMATEFDKKIDRDCRVWASRTLSCCDVRGIA